jgi:hypothetical protein
MFRVLLSFILTAFLFVGILSTANYFLSSETKTPQVISVTTYNVEFQRITIKQIDQLTADYNFPFTSKNSLR